MNDVRMGDCLSEPQRVEVFELIREYAMVFSKGNRLGKIKGHETTIDTDTPLPGPQPMRNAGPAKKQAIAETVDQLWHGT